MDNILDNYELLEKLLKKYSMYKSRITFLDKQLHILTEGVYEHYFDKDKKVEYTQKVKEMSDELARLKYLKSTIEDSMYMVNEVDERYRTIIQKYFFNNVRMEDIAEIMHLSRSRCYELFRESLQTMAKIMFGNAS